MTVADLRDQRTRPSDTPHHHTPALLRLASIIIHSCNWTKKVSLSLAAPGTHTQRERSSRRQEGRSQLRQDNTPSSLTSVFVRVAVLQSTLPVICPYLCLLYTTSEHPSGIAAVPCCMLLVPERSRCCVAVVILIRGLG